MSIKVFHHTYPYAHMNQEVRVWSKIMMNCLNLGLHYINDTRDTVCLKYALMKDTNINIGAAFRLEKKKTQLHQGRRYAFGGLITQFFRAVGVREESLDYMATLIPGSVDVTKTMGSETIHRQTLTTVERNRKNEMIIAHMYELQMLRHRNWCRVSTWNQFEKVEHRYTLNEHNKVVLRLGPNFYEPTDDYIPTDEEKLHTVSNIDTNSEEEVEQPLALEEARGDDDMED